MMDNQGSRDQAVVMTPGDAIAAMAAGKTPDSLVVTGDLQLNDFSEPLRALPAHILIANNIRLVMKDPQKWPVNWPKLIQCATFATFKVENYPGEFPDDLIIQFKSVFTLGDCASVTRAPRMVGAQNPGALLAFTNCPQLSALPDIVRCDSFEISDCPALTRPPLVLETRFLGLSNCPNLQAFSDRVTVREFLRILNCPQVTRLSARMTPSHVFIANCAGLAEIPDTLRPESLTFIGNDKLKRWDNPAVTELDTLDVSACAALEALPPNLQRVGNVQIADCARLTALPAGLRITKQLTISAQSGLRAAPELAHDAQVVLNTPTIERLSISRGGYYIARQRDGLTITAQIAFHPETLAIQQILTEPNLEVREVMIARIGLERFFREANPTVLDSDTVASRARRLLRIDFPEIAPEPTTSFETGGDDEEKRDEDGSYVALEVHDPSTGQLHYVRMPPDMQTCRQAAEALTRHAPTGWSAWWPT